MNNIIEKIKELEGIKLDASSKAAKKEILMMQIRSQIDEKRKDPVNYFDYVKEGLDLFIPQKAINAVRFACRPVVAGVMAMVLALGGGAAAVNASRASLPGDALYAVKIAGEKARVVFSFDESKKAALNLEHVGKRVSELDEIIKGEKAGKDNVRLAISNIKKDIKEVSDNLSKAQESMDPAQTMVIARNIDDKVNEYQRSIKSVKKEAESLSMENMNDVLIALNEAGNRALGYMINSHDGQAGNISKEEIISRVQKKIVLAGEDIEDMVGEMEQEDGSGDEPAQADAEKEIFDNELSGSVKDQAIVKSTSGMAAAPKKPQIPAGSGTEEEQISPSLDNAPAGDGVNDIRLSLVDDPEHAAQMLDEAKDLLEKGEIAQAFERIKETAKITENLKNSAEIDEIEGASGTEAPAADSSDYIGAE